RTRWRTALTTTRTRNSLTRTPRTRTPRTRTPRTRTLQTRRTRRTRRTIGTPTTRPSTARTTGRTSTIWTTAPSARRSRRGRGGLVPVPAPPQQRRVRPAHGLVRACRPGAARPCRGGGPPRRRAGPRQPAPVACAPTPTPPSAHPCAGRRGEDHGRAISRRSASHGPGAQAHRPPLLRDEAGGTRHRRPGTRDRLVAGREGAPDGLRDDRRGAGPLPHRTSPAVAAEPGGRGGRANARRSGAHGDGHGGPPARLRRRRGRRSPRRGDRRGQACGRRLPDAGRDERGGGRSRPLRTGDLPTRKGLVARWEGQGQRR